MSMTRLTLTSGILGTNTKAIFYREDIIDLAELEETHLRDGAPYALVPPELADTIRYSWEGTYFFTVDGEELDSADAWIEHHKIGTLDLEWQSYNCQPAMEEHQALMARINSQKERFLAVCAQEEERKRRVAEAVEKIKANLPKPWKQLLQEVDRLLNGAEILPPQSCTTWEEKRPNNFCPESPDGMRGGYVSSANLGDPPQLVRSTYRQNMVRLTNGEVITIDRLTEDLPPETLLKKVRERLVENLAPHYPYKGRNYWLGVEEYWAECYTTAAISHTEGVFFPVEHRKTDPCSQVPPAKAGGLWE